MIARTGLALVLLAAGCSDTTTELVEARVVLAPSDGAVADGSGMVDAGARMRCGDHACECDNRADDDGDMLLDGFDPECSGAFDDDESSFGTGAGSPALGSCRDCFWDTNASSDDDGCRYSEECLISEMATGPASAGCGGCNVTGRCELTCRPLTPNGCDCFGCCEQKASDGSTVYVQYVDGCSTSDIDDEQKCPRCRPRPECMNGCGNCELCGARKRKDLPAECRRGATDDMPINVCDELETVCTENMPCTLDFYCQLGCCRPIIVQ